MRRPPSRSDSEWRSTRRSRIAVKERRIYSVVYRLEKEAERTGLVILVAFRTLSRIDDAPDHLILNSITTSPLICKWVAEVSRRKEKEREKRNDYTDCECNLRSNSSIISVPTSPRDSWSNLPNNVRETKETSRRRIKDDLISNHDKRSDFCSSGARFQRGNLAEQSRCKHNRFFRFTAMPKLATLAWKLAEYFLSPVRERNFRVAGCTLRNSHSPRTHCYPLNSRRLPVARRHCFPHSWNLFRLEAYGRSFASHPSPSPPSGKHWRKFISTS